MTWRPNRYTIKVRKNLRTSSRWEPYAVRKEDIIPLKQIKKPSAVPFYGVAAVWLLYNLLFPMYSLLHLILCAALSAAAFFLLRKLCPPTIIEVPVEEQKPDTGNPELDAAITQGRQYLKEIRSLNAAIPDAPLSADLDDIEAVTGQIFRQVEREPDKLPKIRTLMNYYLPTTVKLVGKYAELQDQQSLPNVKTMLEEIRSMVGTVKAALTRLLNSLYEHDVIDITADIQVMEQMLSANGLHNSMEKE